MTGNPHATGIARAVIDREQSICQSWIENKSAYPVTQLAES